MRIQGIPAQVLNNTGCASRATSLNVSKLNLTNVLLHLDMPKEKVQDIITEIEKCLGNLQEPYAPGNITLLTTTKLYRIKKEIITGAILMINDKNPGEITEECPLRYFLRIKKDLNGKGSR